MQKSNLLMTFRQKKNTRFKSICIYSFIQDHVTHMPHYARAMYIVLKAHHLSQ